MLVEFSPWDTTDTSLRLSVTKRKRPRGSASPKVSPSQSNSQDEFPIAACFVTARAGRKKKRSNTESSRSVLAVTGSHRVSVLIRKDKAHFSTASHSRAPIALQESSHMQYSCRPGELSSFLPVTDRNENATMNYIPVIFDAKNDRFFGLQGGNKQLIFWNSQCEGPDQVDSKSMVHLQEKAVSLDLLPNGVVIGSCDTGTIFYAFVDDESSALDVKYLPKPSPANRDGPMKEMKLAGSLLVRNDIGGPSLDGSIAGSKRKLSENDHAISFAVYQLFVTGCEARLYRHDLADSEDHSFSLERTKHVVARLSLLPLGNEGEQSSFITTYAALLPTTIGNPTTATLYYEIRPSPSSTTAAARRYCCTIKLQSGTLANPPFLVSCGSERLALVSSRILAAGADDKLLAYDALSGVVLSTAPLPDAVKQAKEGGFLLLSDARTGLLMICFQSEGRLKITTTKLSLENEMTGQIVGSRSGSFVNLADRLAASLVASSGHRLPPSGKERRKLKLAKDEVLQQTSGTTADDINDAVNTMQNFVAQVIKKQGKGYRSGSLTEAFQSSIALASCGNDDSRSRMLPTNGKSRKTQVKKNGLHSGESCDQDDFQVGFGGRSANHKASKKNSLALPLPFVDAVTPLILQLLLRVQSFANLSTGASSEIRQDCCFALSQLILTGKISARRHFGRDHDNEFNNYFLKILRCINGNEALASQVYSPLDLIDDVLRNCPDVSESLMVTMLHYMFSRSRPVDIAHVLARSKDMLPSHPSKVLSCRYLKCLDQSKSDDSVTQKLETLKSRLVIAGSSFVLSKILIYSGCNQALLARALRENLPFSSETSLLIAILTNMAFSGSNLDSSGVTSSRTTTVIAPVAQWIPALLDAIGDDLYRLDEDSRRCLLRLNKKLESARRHTEVVISLEEGLSELTSSIPRRKRRKIDDDHSLPAYSVERLRL